MNKKKLLGLALILSIILTGCTEGCGRKIKNIESNYTGGLNRTLNVYSNDGKLLKTYEGKFDIKENVYGNQILFDLDGKRHIIYNGTVIVDEK